MKSTVISCAVEGNIMIALHASKSVGCDCIKRTWYFDASYSELFHVHDIKRMVVNPIQDGHFWGCSWMGGGGGGGTKAPLPKICHTYSTIMKLGIVIPYLKKIQKIYESRDTPLEFCWHQHFFTGNQEISLYQEIQIQIAFWCIISDPFNIFWVFKDCFNKDGYNFDDVSKNTHSRSS